MIISTGTASGKSLGYLLPALTAVLRRRHGAVHRAHQGAGRGPARGWCSRSELRGVRAAVVDGDTPWADRDLGPVAASYLLTTPDMLHHSLLPQHARWNGFFRRLRYVVVDECHTYRGVFGSHVAHVLRRLRRIGCHHSAADPVVRAGLGHDQRPGRVGRAADRPAGAAGHRRTPRRAGR